MCGGGGGGGGEYINPWYDQEKWANLSRKKHFVRAHCKLKENV